MAPREAPPGRSVLPLAAPPIPIEAMIALPDVRPDPDHRAHPWHWVERPHSGMGGWSAAPEPARWDSREWMLTGSAERYTPDRAATMRWRYLGPMFHSEDVDMFVQRVVATSKVQESHIAVLERSLARRRRGAATMFICGAISAVAIMGAIRALY